MKLSDVKGDRVFDVIADVIDPISVLAEDADVKAIFKRGEKIPDDKTPSQVFMARVKDHLPAILKNHRDSIIAILAAIKGVTSDEYKESITLATLVKDVLELLGDKVFLDFLSSQESSEESEPFTSA